MEIKEVKELLEDIKDFVGGTDSEISEYIQAQIDALT
jgi:hypothetical protein